MNLYEIILEHYAPKDSERGIFTYLLTNSDEEVYEWLKTNPNLLDGRSIYTPYEDNEEDDTLFEIYNDDFEVVGYEKYKDRMIRLKGELNDENAELSDLYYGKTLVGWRTVNEDIRKDQCDILKNSGISIETI
ncbi:hypothetical protein ACS9SB_0016565 [Bacillus subtilis]